jgi:hypothetical protein
MAKKATSGSTEKKTSDKKAGDKKGKAKGDAAEENQAKVRLCSPYSDLLVMRQLLTTLTGKERTKVRYSGQCSPHFVRETFESNRSSAENTGLFLPSLPAYVP